MNGTHDFMNAYAGSLRIAGLMYLYPKLSIIFVHFAYLKRIPKTGCIVETTPRTSTLLIYMKGIPKTEGVVGIGPKTGACRYPSLTLGTPIPGFRPTLHFAYT